MTCLWMGQADRHSRSRSGNDIADQASVGWLGRSLVSVVALFDCLFTHLSTDWSCASDCAWLVSARIRSAGTGCAYSSTWNPHVSNGTGLIDAGVRYTDSGCAEANRPANRARLVEAPVMRMNRAGKAENHHSENECDYQNSGCIALLSRAVFIDWRALADVSQITFAIPCSALYRATDPHIPSVANPCIEYDSRSKSQSVGSIGREER